MKSIPHVLVATLLVFFAASAQAQAPPPRFELTPFLGELYGGRIAPPPGPDAVGAGEQHLDDHLFGGLRAAYFPGAKLGFELELSRVATTASIRDSACGQDSSSCSYDATLEYALVSGVLRGSGRVQPYVELGGGVCRIATLYGRDGGTGSATRATASLGLGVNFGVSEHLSVRLDARGYATDISGLDIGPVCTTFSRPSPGDPVEPVPCQQDHWLMNAALSAGLLIKL
jgi:hypothetical protein